MEQCQPCKWSDSIPKYIVNHLGVHPQMEMEIFIWSWIYLLHPERSYRNLSPWLVFITRRSRLYKAEFPSCLPGGNSGFSLRITLLHQGLHSISDYIFWLGIHQMSQGPSLGKLYFVQRPSPWAHLHITSLQTPFKFDLKHSQVFHFLFEQTSSHANLPPFE
jgi:hypothetical protein